MAEQKSFFVFVGHLYRVHFRRLSLFYYIIDITRLLHPLYEYSGVPPPREVRLYRTVVDYYCSDDTE